jgi:hypothetical protein
VKPFNPLRIDGSPRHRHAVGKISAQQSRVTNGRGLLPGVDHRSAMARRFADLVASYRQGIGLLDQRGMMLVKSAASCGLQLERLQAQILRDEAVDTRLLVRLTNAQSRALAALGALAAKAEKARSEGPTLQEHLAMLVAKREEREVLGAEIAAASETPLDPP